MPVPEPKELATVQLIAGFTAYQRRDGIHVFRFSDNRRETADAWSAKLLALEHAAAEHNAHIRSLYYFQGIWITPYIIQTAIRTARQGPELIKSSTAILVADNMGMAMLQTVLRKFPAQALQARQIFTDEAKALAWLDERLALLENVPVTP